MTPRRATLAIVKSNSSQLAMIFDLDGVLVHSMPMHILAWEAYLAKLGIEVKDLEQRMHGKRNAELVRDLFGENLTDAEVFEHGAAKERLFRKMLLEAGVEKYRLPGLVEFLERHPEVPKAVGSNAEPANIDFVLEQFGLRPYFKVIVNGLQVSRPKPFPDIYLEAAARMHATPGNCVVFEDSPTGVEAGRTAGMRVVGVKTTPAEFDGVELTINDFRDSQLEPWLTSQKAT